MKRSAPNTLNLTLIALVLSIGSIAFAQTGPIPSWNGGVGKKAIVEFVGKVTKEGGRHFVRPAVRIAVFDNDGTL
jgi:hypothetical protein